MARAEPPLRLREGLPARRAVGHRGRPSGRTPGGGAVWADASGGRSHRGREGEADMRGEGKGSAEDSLSGGRSPLTGPGGLSGRSASCGFAGLPFPGIALRDRGGWPAGRDGAGRGGRAIRGGSSAGLNATGGLVEESARMAPGGLFGGEDAPAAEGGTRAGGAQGENRLPGRGSARGGHEGGGELVRRRRSRESDAGSGKRRQGVPIAPGDGPGWGPALTVGDPGRPGVPSGCRIGPGESGPLPAMDPAGTRDQKAARRPYGRVTVLVAVLIAVLVAVLVTAPGDGPRPGGGPRRGREPEGDAAASWPSNGISSGTNSGISSGTRDCSRRWPPSRRWTPPRPGTGRRRRGFLAE
jgi:hypothetical protein